MSKAIKELRLDHSNFMKLLAVLEAELAVFDQGGSPDYEMIDTAADYFSNYAENFHHPLENAVYAQLQARDPAAAEAIGDLEKEHEATSAAAAAFREATRAILNEAELPRDLFHQRSALFIEKERAHIAMEERQFFPEALRCLTAEDWQAVKESFSKEADPLFGPETREDFRELIARVTAWEKDNRDYQKAAGA